MNDRRSPIERALPGVQHPLWMLDIGVQVVVGDASLRGALAARIARAPGFSVTAQSDDFDGIAPGELVLTTPADCSTQQCAELVKNAIHVVLLAPMPRETERVGYAFAGGRYIAMLLDTEELFEALLHASSGSQVPG